MKLFDKHYELTDQLIKSQEKAYLQQVCNEYNSIVEKITTEINARHARYAAIQTLGENENSVIFGFDIDSKFKENTPKLVDWAFENGARVCTLTDIPKFLQAQSKQIKVTADNVHRVQLSDWYLINIR